MSNHVTDHGRRLFLGVTLVFSRVVFKMQRKHFSLGSSSRQLHVTVRFPASFWAAGSFPRSHMWEKAR